MNPIQKWYEVVKTHDLSKLDTLLDENVIFYSPIVYTPQRGKNITKTYLMAASKVLDENKSLEYIKEVIGNNSAVLEFKTEVDGIYINGIDLISWNEEGKITEFKVMVRPLKAVNKLHERMQILLFPKKLRYFSWLKKFLIKKNTLCSFV
ncbi:MAG: hypothetical protein CBC47_06645 [Alphaproteobacteria bacterium TMED87]|nr:hypothetical protein [Rhodospirillaceae bacterium]OUV08874.1 MAG: hypothetical protein CBC47_06645 [Alphaproteobacteria bacterium TMED87]